MRKYIPAIVLLLMLACAGDVSAAEESASPVVAGTDAAEITAKATADVQKNLDFIWVLTAAAIVFIMQAGFMCLESGMARAKNSINVAIKNMADFVLAVAGFWAIGFGLMFGLSNSGWFGWSDFFMLIEQDPWRAAFFVFQAVFCGTAATIDSGAVAERTRFSAYLVMSFITSCLIYPIFGHWAWGSFLHGEAAQGWLEAKGFIDFAGSSVVHSVGAWVALAGLIVIGPRIGRFDENGNPKPIPPHNLPLVCLGAFLLFFGWFGFNCGSTLAATADVAGVAMNTIIAACFGGMTCAGLSWFVGSDRVPSPEQLCNGMLGGLVGITAGCACVETTGAAVIGVVSGLIVYVGVIAVERLFRLDDVVTALPVHGFCGAWGTIAVGIFIRPELLTMSRWDQVVVQLIGVAACFAWAFPCGFIALKAVDMIWGLRVSPEEEHIGLNVAEHGASSSLLDLAQSMQRATTSKTYDESLKVNVESGTEIGDLASCFNSMIDAVIEQRREIDDKLQKSFHYLKYMERNVEEIGNHTGNMEDLLASTASQADQITSAVSGVDEIMKNLIQSLSEITENTSHGTRIAREAHGATEQSVETVRILGESADQIGAIVSMIEDIAGQTKLLALNATIEASRAGEAGKGFAVVADEVKGLSAQSQASAESIGRQIEGIQSKTQSTVDSIDGISGIIHEINEINHSIAKTIECHEVSTREVESQVQSTADVASDMRNSIHEVQVGIRQVSQQVRSAFDEFQKLFADSESFTELPEQQGQTQTASPRPYGESSGFGHRLVEQLV